MNPLNTFYKAKKWAQNRAKTFSKDGRKSHFVVCTYNKDYIVHESKQVYTFKNEYLSEEILYCTDENEMKKIIYTLRFIK